MFIPLYDVNKLRYIKVQSVTIGLIVVNIGLWIFTGLLAPEPTVQKAIAGLGYIPAIVFGYARLEPNLVVVSPFLTYVTYAFFHTGFWHMVLNMLFLWTFGDNVEDALGHTRFLIFYLLCAAAGALSHGLFNPTSQFPLIGASGAISGVIAAYVLLHPRVWIWFLAFGPIPLPLPAFIPLLVWIGQQFWMTAIDRNGQVSWGAHTGGILAGLLLVTVLRRKGVPLLDWRIVTPRAVETEPEPQDVPRQENANRDF